VTVSFEQAAIKVEKEREFGLLRAAIDRVFAPARVEKLLSRMQRKGIRVRDFDLVLASGILEDEDDALARSGKAARQWYQELATSDQAQLREFYLFRLEEVSPELRERFSKLYAYY
jgi:hypothetical protein